MKAILRWSFFALAIVIVVFATRNLSSPNAPQAQPENARALAPDFPSDLQWINTAHPLSIKKLHGKIVLLDFWTYGCINCIHILPDLDRLQKDYRNQLAVISVHSAKFQNEKDATNIRNAVLRYHIEHPVAVDDNLAVWDAYGVNAWPSLILIDPNGRIAGRWSGEGHFTEIDTSIKNLIATFRSRKELNETPLEMALESASVAQTPLLFPGKVLSQNGKLYIADSGHHRIVQTDDAGKVLFVAGSGQPGLKDGSLKSAQFQFPQGMALSADGKVLFVADTDNHAIRAVNFSEGTVKTIAGNGKQAAFGSSGGRGTSAALSSPWDLCRVNDILYIAMAGTHQIWTLNLNDLEVHPFAGSGREARTDGDARYAAFAQPSGLASDGKVLFVADSESSSIRAIDLQDSNHPVKTLAGGDLFDFGDRDGIGLNSRFQHPLGLTTNGKVLLITDTYNHKVKRLNLADNSVTTLLGSQRGMSSGADARFYEPGGLSLDGEKLYIADTNNNRILRTDIKGADVTVIPVNPPLPVSATPHQSSLHTQKITLPKVLLAPAAKGILKLNITLPARHHLNAMSPQSFKIQNATGITFTQTSVDRSHFRLPLQLDFTTAQNGQGTLQATAEVYYCTNDFGLCKWKELQFTVPYAIAANGQNAIQLSATIDR